jgi:hypothetical protein
MGGQLAEGARAFKGLTEAFDLRLTSENKSGTLLHPNRAA